MALHGSEARPKKILIVVENLSVPFDRRVWNEATTLVGAGYEVSIICPTGPGAEARHEILNGIHIFRHPLPIEARGGLGYLLEYSIALFWEFILAWKVLRTRGFDAIHACNPPDLIFLVGGFSSCSLGQSLSLIITISIRNYSKRSSSGKAFCTALSFLERITFRTADISIATNKSYRAIAIERGGMTPDRVFVVRSGPNLERYEFCLQIQR